MDWHLLEYLRIWTVVWNEPNHPQNGVVVRVSSSLAPTQEIAEQIARYLLDRYPFPTRQIVRDSCCARCVVPNVSGFISLQFIKTEKDDHGTCIISPWGEGFFSEAPQQKQVM